MYQNNTTEMHDCATCRQPAYKHTDGEWLCGYHAEHSHDDDSDPVDLLEWAEGDV